MKIIIADKTVYKDYLKPKAKKTPTLSVQELECPNADITSAETLTASIGAALTAAIGHQRYGNDNYDNYDSNNHQIIILDDAGTIIAVHNNPMQIVDAYEWSQEEPDPNQAAEEEEEPLEPYDDGLSPAPIPAPKPRSSYSRTAGESFVLAGFQRRSFFHGGSCIAEEMKVTIGRPIAEAFTTMQGYYGDELAEMFNSALQELIKMGAINPQDRALQDGLLGEIMAIQIEQSLPSEPLIEAEDPSL
ncbi:MAG: hypothetical protein WAX89_02650 [Alphaproteobacteria bacterium]